MAYIVFICTAAYILGIALSPLINISYFVFFTVGLLCAAAITKIFMKFRVLPILIAGIMLLFGSVRYTIATRNVLFETFPEKYVEITGTVASLPRHSDSKYRYRYEVDLDSVKYLDSTYRADAKILLNTEEKLKYGDSITAWGFLTDFSEAANEFDFNYRLYYKSRGILCRLTALDIVAKDSAKSHSPAFLLGRTKERIYENMETVLSKKDFAFASATVFGDKSHFSDKYRSLLIKTGVFRALYSPFSHLSVMLIFAALIFRNKNRQMTLFGIMVALYLLFFNRSPTALKAGVVAVVLLLMKRYKGYSDKLGTVSSVALLLTLINPLLCFDGGFMMSVISSVMLCFSYKPVKKFLSKSRFLRRRRLTSPLSLWIVLVFGTMPFAAYYFNGVSVYSLLFFPFVLPFVAVLIALTPFIFIKIGWLSWLLLPMYREILGLLREIPELVSRLPFYHIMLPHPSGLKIILGCLAWWVFIRALKSRFNTASTKLILSAMAGIFLCIAIDFSINSLAIYFVNVGQGDAAILHTSRGETVLIDGGGAGDYEENYNIGENVFLPYLISHGFTHIDTAIVSHYHKDHVEGIIAAAENLKINTLILPDCMPENKFRQRLEKIADSRHINIEYLRLGDEIRFRSGLTLTVIAPDNALIDKDNENDTSLVLSVKYGDFSALFTGDFEAEEDLVPPQNIDVLKVGHHGSKDANDFEFLHSVNPRIAVISVGKHNRYGLPSKAVVSELESEGVTVLRTDDLGDIRITTDKKADIKYHSLIGGNSYAKKRR